MDETPQEGAEFTTPGNQGEQNRVDLLSALMHEIGHVLGHDHDADGLMDQTLTAGTRREPGLDARLADWTVMLSSVDAAVDARTGFAPTYPWAAEEVTVIYRPSFGRRGRPKPWSRSQSPRAEFGEFDALLGTPKAVYAIESKWTGSSDAGTTVIQLSEDQVHRHSVPDLPCALARISTRELTGVLAGGRAEVSASPKTSARSV